MDQVEKRTFTDEEALSFHRYPTPGKIGVIPTKPMGTQRDLSLAYSPGVAVPVLAIAKDPEAAYDYTSKGNLVAVISNGTAILGLGNLGALASKPVMEGKGVLFKRGHVFSSVHTDDETALQRLLDGLDAPTIGDPRLLRFTAGRREKLWEKNCVAIGLAGGFIEPLESTSIHLIQSGIFRLMALFPDRGFNQVEIDEYNRWLVEEYEHIRDFIILHYHATERSDSGFWNHCRTMDLPDSLAARIALWREKGRIFRAHNSLFTEESWIAVLLGQNIVPRAADPLVAMLPVGETTQFMNHMREIVARTAEAMPRHEDYIAQHCAAQPATSR